MSFSEIEPNGSLMLAWQVKNRHVLVVGGGEVAASRIYHLLNANAKITVVSPTINAEIMHRQSQGLLHSVHERAFQPSDLVMYEKAQPALQDFNLDEFSKIDEYVNNQRFQLVLVAIDDPVESKKIYYQCKLRGLNVNIADVPKLCDFYFGSVLRKGSLQLMISTNGKSPRIARLVKDKISEKFETDQELQNIETVVERIGLLRGLLRKKLPDNDLDSIDKRMKWMIKVTDMFTFSQWSQVNVEKIINYFPDFPPSDPALLH